MVTHDDDRRRAASVQRQHQDQTSSPLSRRATHTSFVAARAAMHSNHAARIGAPQHRCILAAAASRASRHRDITCSSRTASNDA
jgi:hypothetical protein